jgi:hypothetical protein
MDKIPWSQPLEIRRSYVASNTKFVISALKYLKVTNYMKKQFVTLRELFIRVFALSFRGITDSSKS